MKAKKKPPVQARAIETYERLLTIAQDILEEDGIESLNSNAIVQRAGMTPPTFYRYFKDRYAILEELGQRLTDAQNNLLGDNIIIPETYDEYVEQAKTTLAKTLDVTRKFKGGYALLVSLRAIPQLRSIRIDSNNEMAQQFAIRFIEAGTEWDEDDIFDRCRLMIEYGYSVIEMLFENDFRNEEHILELTAKTTAAIFDLHE